MIKCPECGKDIPDNVKLCPECGYPLKKDKKSPVVIILIIIIIILLVVICVGAYFLLNNNTDINLSSPEEATEVNKLSTETNEEDNSPGSQNNPYSFSDTIIIDGIKGSDYSGSVQVKFNNYDSTTGRVETEIHLPSSTSTSIQPVPDVIIVTYVDEYFQELDYSYLSSDKSNEEFFMDAEIYIHGGGTCTGWLFPYEDLIKPARYLVIHTFNADTKESKSTWVTLP